jgi:hypothetical protein
MGIQISEDKLSDVAKKALSNANNKSQFLRDAIEFYVRRGLDASTDDTLKVDIKEIKTMLIALNLQLASGVIPVATNTFNYGANIVQPSKEEVKIVMAAAEVTQEIAAAKITAAYPEEIKKPFTEKKAASNSLEDLIDNSINFGEM